VGISYTGKNNLMRCVTHREAVFGTAICSIFDVWHNEVLSIYLLTRLVWYACDFVRWIRYSTLHTTNLQASCQMHFIARSLVRSEVHSWLHSIAHSQPAWLYPPNCSRWHTLNLLWLTLSSKLSRHSQVPLRVRSKVHLRVRSEVHSRACSQGCSGLCLIAHSQPAWLYAPK